MASKEQEIINPLKEVKIAVNIAMGILRIRNIDELDDLLASLDSKDFENFKEIHTLNVNYAQRLVTRRFLNLRRSSALFR